MNIAVHRFFWIGVSGFLEYNPSSGIAGSKGSSIITLFLDYIMNPSQGFLFFFFLRFHLFIFREMGREGEREGEKHQCVVASSTPSTGDLSRNPGMCPDGNQTSDPFCFIGRRSIHWAPPARADCFSSLTFQLPLPIWKLCILFFILLVMTLTSLICMFGLIQSALNQNVCLPPKQRMMVEVGHFNSDHIPCHIFCLILVPYC